MGGDLSEGAADGGKQCLGCPRFGAAQERFDFAPHLFDRVEVGRVGGQEEDFGARGGVILMVGSLLCGARLSMTTRSPGRSVGQSTSAT